MVLFFEAVVEELKHIGIYFVPVELVENLMSVIIIQSDAYFTVGIVCVDHERLPYALSPVAYRIFCT